MTDNIYPEYGNAIYKFPRTTKEAFGHGEAIFVATEDEDLGSNDLEWSFAIVVYAMALFAVITFWWVQ